MSLSFGVFVDLVVRNARILGVGLWRWFDLLQRWRDGWDIVDY